MFNPTILLFIPVTWLDVLDILMVAIIMYQSYKLIKGTVVIRIFLVILAIYFFWKIAEILQMRLLSEILGQFIGVGVLALIIVFQQEIRRFLLMIGNNNLFSKAKGGKFLSLLNAKNTPKNILNIDQVILACKNLSKSKTGALIILDLNTELRYYLTSGEEIDSNVSATMLESIFFKNSPLHDGGVIIIDNKIKAASCILPVSEKQSFPPHFGLRHRAAAGITEASRAIAIIISEETGSISLSKGDEISYDITLKELEKRLKDEVS